MPSSTIAAFNEPRAFEAALQQGCRVELLVTERGQFKAELITITLPRLRLLRARERLSRIAVVSVAHGSIVFIFQTEPERSHKFRGVGLSAAQMMTVTANERLHTWTAGLCSWGIICVPAKELIKYGQALVGRKFALPSGVCRLRPGRDHLRALVALFNATMRLTEAHPSRPVETAGAVRGLEQETIGVLVACLSSGTVQAREEPRGHSEMMARLDQLLQACPHQIHRVRDICAALGVSEKALQACCLQQVGVGLSRYFHLHGMRRVHKALADAQPETASVSRLAKCHGFNEAGRFAAAYRKQFGQLPSATLRQFPGT